MHASIACLLLYEDYVWVSLGNVMKAKQSKAKQSNLKLSKVLSTNKMIKYLHFAEDLSWEEISNIYPSSFHFLSTNFKFTTT